MLVQGAGHSDQFGLAAVSLNTQDAVLTVQVLRTLECFGDSKSDNPSHD